MYIAGVIYLCLMLTSNTVVATQELKPQIFSDNYIDLNSCDFSQPMCNHDSFKNSGLDTIKKLHELKCVRNTDMDGNFRGYDACNPQHMSPAWYRDKCLNKSEFKDCCAKRSIIIACGKIDLHCCQSFQYMFSKQTTIMISRMSP